MDDAEYLYLVALNAVSDDVRVTAMHLFARVFDLSGFADLRVLGQGLCLLMEGGDDAACGVGIVA